MSTKGEEQYKCLSCKEIVKGDMFIIVNKKVNALHLKSPPPYCTLALMRVFESFRLKIEENEPM